MSPEALKAFFAARGGGGGNAGGTWAVLAPSASASQNYSPHAPQPFVKGYKPKGYPDRIRPPRGGR